MQPKRKNKYDKFLYLNLSLDRDHHHPFLFCCRSAAFLVLAVFEKHRVLSRKRDINLQEPEHNLSILDYLSSKTSSTVLRRGGYPATFYTRSGMTPHATVDSFESQDHSANGAVVSSKEETSLLLSYNINKIVIFDNHLVKVSVAF